MNQMPSVEVKDLRINYALEGRSDAAALVLSNSLGTNYTMWDPQVPEFLKTLRVLRYDTRGHGQSSVTPGPYSIEQLGKDLLGLADAAGVKSFHFCGLSMGGMIGMWLAAHAPERVNKLVLCNTAAKIGTFETWNARIAAIQKDGMKPMAAAVVERWFTPPFREKDRATVAQTQKMLEEANPEGYAANCAAVRDFDFRERLGEIHKTTLVISGKHDTATTPADGRFLAEHIEGARYAELNAAHLSNIEDREPFTREVSKFLNS
jgi:3-oxoadipate enol-lactonase